MEENIDFSQLSNLKYLSSVFKYLRGGHYLCAHSPERQEQLWYEEVRTNYPLYAEAYNLVCGERLVDKESYFFFGANPTENKDAKRTSIKEEFIQFDMVMRILNSILSNIEPGNDRLRFSTLQLYIETKPDAIGICKELFKDVKKAGANESSYYTSLLLNLMEKDLEIIRHSGEGPSTIYIIQDSYLRFKELVHQLKLHNLDSEDEDDPFADKEVQAMLALFPASDTKGPDTEKDIDSDIEPEYNEEQ